MGLFLSKQVRFSFFEFGFNLTLKSIVLLSTVQFQTRLGSRRSGSVTSGVSRGRQRGATVPVDEVSLRNLRGHWDPYDRYPWTGGRPDYETGLIAKTDSLCGCVSVFDGSLSALRRARGSRDPSCLGALPDPCTGGPAVGDGKEVKGPWTTSLDLRQRPGDDSTCTGLFVTRLCEIIPIN